MCNVSLLPLPLPSPFLLPPYPPFIFLPPSLHFLPSISLLPPLRPSSSLFPPSLHFLPSLFPPPSSPPFPPPSQGKDDLRQDAVMQQVFVLVNRLLRKEPATCKRRLSIRTYKVGLSVCPVWYLCSVRLFFWSLSPSHNSPTPSPTLHTLSTHSPHTHILTIHPHPCLYPQPSHISLIPHLYPPTPPIPIPHTLTGDSTLPTLRDSGMV